jgi:hypothetical protein
LPNGTIANRDRNGRTTSVTTPRGTTARMDNRGRPVTIQDKRGNTIHMGPGGQRRVVTVRPDHSRVVSYGNRGGYVERPINRGGGSVYVQRTYVVAGHTSVYVYRGYPYRGRVYYGYIPPFYYAPAYYGWVYNPWPRPIYYTWGWYSAPWYRPYGYYFRPYPVYPYASLWLTDYLIADNLQFSFGVTIGSQPTDSQGAMVYASYRPGADPGDQAAPGPQGAVPSADSAVLTPAVKNMIADEVKSVVADQQKAAASPSSASQSDSGDQTPAALDSEYHVFVVFSVQEVTTNGGTCALTSSDVVQRTEDAPDTNDTIAVKVLASKTSECAIGSTGRMQLSDLNDMQNHLVEQVDAGMKMLAANQGKDGLPAAPAADPRAVPDGTATPDPTAAADLKEQETEADQSEKEVQDELAADSAAAPSN